MKLVERSVLPVTKYRKEQATIHKFTLDNGMNVEIADTSHGVASIYASTQILEHSSIEAAETFLTKLNDLEVFNVSRIDFHKVREFAQAYKHDLGPPAK